MNGETESENVVRKGPSGGMIALLAALAIFIIINVVLIGTGAFVDEEGNKLKAMEIIGIIVAAGLSLSIYSFLYSDNPLFKFAEHLYVGISVGYLITLTVHQNLKQQVWDPLISKVIQGDFREAEWLVIVPVIFGLFMFARFMPKIAWVSRYAFALLVGFGAGLAVPLIIPAYLFKQTQATLTPFNSSPSIWGNICVFVIFVVVLSVLVYFFFSVKHEGPIKPVARAGTYFIMVSFGATFGFTVMGRLALLIGQIEFLLADWLHVMVK